MLGYQHGEGPQTTLCGSSTSVQSAVYILGGNRWTASRLGVTWMAWRAQAGEKLVSAFVRLQPWITGFGAPRVGHEEMEKAIILIGAYALASFIGALTGAMLWAEPFRMDDILGFMMMCPLFQFVSLITAFNTKNLILGILLLVVCGGTMTASVVWYYRSNRKWPVLTFAAPVFVASLQGAELLCEAIAA